MYVKLFQQILDSSIAEDRRLRHFFIDLLLCSDSSGLVMKTEEAIARATKATIEEVRWGLAELEKPDPKSKSPEMGGRRIVKLEGVGYGWQIVNYTHYRGLKDAEQLRDSTRVGVRRHREKLKSLKAGETPSNAGNGITEAEAPGEAEIEKRSTSSLAPSLPATSPTSAWPAPHEELKPFQRWWTHEVNALHLQAQRRFVDDFDGFMDVLDRAYPEVDLPAELAAAYAWEEANQKKTPKGRKRFLRSWVERAANSLKYRNGGTTVPYSNSVPR